MIINSRMIWTVFFLILFSAGIANALTLTGTATYDAIASEASVYAYDNSTVNTYDGSNTSYIRAYGNSDINVNGGTISYLSMYDDSTASILGGTISYLRMYENSTADIFSTLSLGYLIVDNGSLVNLYGYDFDYSSNHISGYWGNGVAFSFWAIENSELQSGSLSNILPDNIILHDITQTPVPEPSTLLLLSLGAFGFIRKKKQIS